jgi:hypothetical protein
MIHANARLLPALGLALVALAGCETVSEEVDRLESYNDMANAYNDLRYEVQEMTISGAEMPNTGSATYTGYATLLVNSPNDTALVGDARIEADFTNSTLNGNLTNFVGTVDGDGYDDFSGSIALKDGEIGATTASSLTADIKGSLSNDEDLVTVNGGVVGNFRTDGELNAAGLTALDTSSTEFTVNGQSYGGDLGIVAIR